MSLPLLPTPLRFQITEEKLLISKNGLMATGESFVGGKLNPSSSIHTPNKVQIKLELCAKINKELHFNDETKHKKFSIISSKCLFLISVLVWLLTCNKVLTDWHRPWAPL